MPPMQQTPQRLRRIQYVTRHFQELQGLRYVPYALAGMAVTLLVGVGGIIAVVAVLLLLGVGIGLGPLIARYYTRTYGQVTRTPAESARRRAVVIVIVIVIMILFLPYPSRLVFPPQYLQLNAALLPLAAAVVLLAGFGWGERLRMRPYWAVMGAVLITLDLMLLLLGSGALPTPSGVMDILDIRALAYTDLLRLYVGPIALVLAIGGVLDHLLLVRTFAPREAVQ